MKEWIKIQIIVICAVLGAFAYIVVMGAVFGPPQTILGLLAFVLPGANLLAWCVSKVSN